MRARRAGEFRLFLGRTVAITRAPMLCAICTGEVPRPAGGVNQRRLALLKGISIVREINGPSSPAA